MSSPDLAKPTGVLYETHIADVIAQLDELYKYRPFIFDKYQREFHDDLYEMSKLACEWHDRGKLFSSWQGPCQLDFERYKRLSDKDKKTFKATHLQNNKYRHEFISLLSIDKHLDKIDLRVKIAVAAHHGKLSKKYESRWSDHSEFKQNWNTFKIIANETSQDTAILDRYRNCSVRAILKYCDERASRIEDNQSVISPHKSIFKYDFPDAWKKRGVQSKIDELKDEPISILRAPTGSGKTHASFLWAQHQIDNKRADRLVIAMPTKFTANGILNSTSDIVSSGVYHSSAKFNEKQNSEDMLAAKSLELACNIVTVDQLCLCLTSTAEHQQGIFFNLANSCVVFDEADFYDDFIQYNILELLKALKILKVPVLIMSATVPNAHLSFYSQAGIKLNNIFHDNSRDFHKKFSIKNVGNVSELSDISEIFSETISGKPTIIYANTVRRAQSFYTFLKDKGVECVLYHSQFKECDKQAIEQRIIEMLGEEAWKNGTEHGVVVMSQIGEMSVNISADIMFTDFCPIDRLIQRFGRLSRFKEQTIGQAFTMVPFNKDKDKIFPYPYALEHEPIKALSKTIELLVDEKYSFGELLTILEKIYTRIPDKNSKIKGNVDSYIKMIKNNWLILPEHIVLSEDEIENQLSDKWKCRDMLPTCILFCDEIDTDYLRFKNYYQFQEYCLEHTISVALYIRNKLKTLGLCSSFTYYIGTEPFIGVRICESYDSEFGLMIDKKKDEGAVW